MYNPNKNIVSYILDDDLKFWDELSKYNYATLHYKNKDLDELLILMLKNRSLKCIQKYVSEISKIDLKDVINLTDYKTFKFLSEHRLVKFKTKKTKKTKVSKKTKVWCTSECPDTPHSSMNAGYYLRIAVEKNDLNFVSYFLQAKLDVHEALGLTRQNYHAPNPCWSNALIPLAGKFENKDVALTLAYMTRSIINEKSVKHDNDLKVRGQLEHIIRSLTKQATKHALA